MSHTTPEHGKTRRVGIALALAGVLGAGALAVPALTSSSVPALAAAQARTFEYQPTQFADLVDEVRPAVVSITVEGKSKRGQRFSRNMPQFPDLPEGHPFREFFDRFAQPNTPEGRRQFQRRSLSQGSGFIISEDGFVVTNNHVIDGGDSVKVKTTDGKSYDAELIGRDSKTDLALLKIKSSGKFKAVKFADKEARVGDWVVAVGNPFGLGGSVTTGIISARGREIGSGPYDDFLQIDAPINRGNSGGPAFNLDGDVVGVNTAIFSPSGGNVGIGFAIPANIVERVIADLKDDGKVTRGFLGVNIQSVTEDIAESLGLASADGAMVTRVTEGSPADKAGFRTGDTILKVNGKTVKGPRDLARKIAAIDPGEDAKIDLLRDGSNMTKTVEIGLLPGSDKLASSSKPSKTKASLTSLGLSLTGAETGDGDDGVVVADVDPDGPAARKGIRPGDRIIEVAGKAVDSPRDVRKRLDAIQEQGRKSVLFLVRPARGEQQRFVAIPLKDA